MRTTRAYAAGLGTASSMLAGAAILFVLASAIIAFQGWPRIASQASPASLQLAPAPDPGSRVSRRLRAAGLGAPAPVVLRHAAPRHVGRRIARATGPVGFRTPVSPRRTAGRSGTRGAAAASLPGTGVRVPGGGPDHGITITTPTLPPLKVTLPAGQIVGAAGNVAKSVTGVASSVVKKVGGVLSSPGPVLGP